MNSALVIESFEDWLVRVVSPTRHAEPMTFEQQARYIEGWQGSLLFSYKGMPAAYFWWAHHRFPALAASGNASQVLRAAWQYASMHRAAEALAGRGVTKTAEETADWFLETFFLGLPSLIYAHAQRIPCGEAGAAATAGEVTNFILARLANHLSAALPKASPE